MATPRKRPEDKLKTGRPPKTEVESALAKAICDNLELAMPLRPAAEAEGVPDATVREWVEKFPAFAAQVTRARARAMKNLVVRSLGGGKGSSNSEFHLERRFRQDYGPVQKIVLETDDELTDDERAAQTEAYKRTILGQPVPDGSGRVDDSGAGAAGADTGSAPPGTTPKSREGRDR
jgi:hypothetical protein